MCMLAVVMCWCQLTPRAWMLTLKFLGVQAMGEHYRWDTTSMCHELPALRGPVLALSVCWLSHALFTCSRCVRTFPGASKPHTLFQLQATRPSRS